MLSPKSYVLLVEKKRLLCIQNRKWDHYQGPISGRMYTIATWTIKKSPTLSFSPSGSLRLTTAGQQACMQCRLWWLIDYTFYLFFERADKQ